LESLEKRQMLAGDTDLLFTDGVDVVHTSVAPAETSTSLPVEGQAEGEPEPDLVQFAKDLTAAGAQFFGAAWCPACTAQKQLFEDGGNELPFIEVTNPDRTLNSIGQPQNENITVFPTWKFPSGAVVTGVQSLDELATLLGNGYTIPQSEQPTFEPIGNQTVGIGSPLHIPVDAYDPDGGPLTVTVSVDNPSLVEATVLSGNRSIRIDVAGWGDMLFELFEQRAPRPTARIIELVEDKFFDDDPLTTAIDGIKFHRIVDDFVLQAGDPTATGSGGSDLGDFDDQFHPDLQHNRSGILSYAKSSDDTNDSQFFITEPATRHLDFNHSIFGQLVEGDSVREAISETAVTGSVPDIDVVINAIELIPNDIENSVVMLKALGNTPGSTNVTFTVTDQDDNTHSETISVTVANDSANGQPYLDPITPPGTTSNTLTAELQLSSVDVEDDAVTYFTNGIASASGGTVSVSVLTSQFDPNRGQSLVTVTPETGSAEPIKIQLDTVAPTSEAVTYFATVVSGAANGTVDIDAATGLVTVTPNASSNGLIQFRVGSRNVAQTLFGVTSESISTPEGTVVVDSTSGLSTLTPSAGFEGTIDVQLAVQPAPGVFGNALGDFDSQSVAFAFEGEQTIAAPTSVDLQTASDTGVSNIDNITNAPSLGFTVNGVTSGATVELVNIDSGSVVGTGVATGTSIVITTNNIEALGDGTYPIAARQRVGADVSDVSPTITLVFDTTAPDSVVASAATNANLFRLYQTDLISTEEGSGLVYQLTTAPSGASIDSATGQIEWTPVSEQLGDNTFTVELTDAAGNTLTESFTVSVAGEPLAEIRIDLTDLQGNPISSVAIGEEFLMNMVAVDARLFNKPGIFAAYADILFDSSIVRPVPGTDIQFSSDFSVVLKGTFAPGLIDELGGVRSVAQATNDPENLVATVRMEALATGTVNIRSEPADESDSDVLLFFEDDKIPADAVLYGSRTLAVGQSFTVGADTFTVAEDSGATELDVLANDEIISGSDTLTIVSVTQPTAGGTVSFTGQAVTFTPADDFNGTSIFTYRVSDSSGIQEDGTVTVTVSSVNDAPTAVNDIFNIDQSSTDNSLDVLGNDLITPDSGESLTITAVGPASEGGTVTIAPGGQSVLYTPVPGFTGTETFSYTMSDGGLTDSGEVTVTVASVDNPPTAVADEFTVDEDADQDSFDVTSNDTRDIDDQVFTISSVGTPSQGGTASVSGDGLQILYQPAENFAGTETVTYTIRDTGGGLAVGTVTFTVDPLPDAPPIDNPTLSLIRGSDESSIYEISDLPENPDAGETLTFSLDSSTTTAGGSVRVAGTAENILYTPPSPEFTGVDTFTYRVADGTGLTSTGTITVDVLNFTERSILLELSSIGANSRIGGIMLKGTNLLGDTVEVPLTFDSDTASFNNLLPGDYTIEIPAIPFLQNTGEKTQIAVSSAAEDSDATISTDLGRIRPEYLSIHDWLGSAPEQNLLVAVSPGGSSALVVASPSTTIIKDPDVDLNAAGDTLTIRGTQTDPDTSTDSLAEATLPTDGGSNVQLRGEVDGMRLYKIHIDESVNFVEPVGGGEGEAISSFALADIQAEGESPAASATTQADVFVPVNNNSVGNQAAVLALSDGDVWVAGESQSAEQNPNTDTQTSVDRALRTVTDLSLDSAVSETIANDSSLNQQLVDKALSDALDGPL
jgi:cyclophilin family peptidyl-prolyl cis-trans isomerase